MVLESTMICVDNSDYMRNGDFLPTRIQAQQDAVNLVTHSKTRSNPESNVGLISMAGVEVLVTLTSDSGRILSRLHQVAPKGDLNFLSAIRVAHLALKHRQGKNHKMRIIAFVGSPVTEDDKELVKLAKKLKKEKVNVDIINFGEESVNTEKLTTFVNTINGKDGTSSHLVTVPPGPILSDALVSSPIVVGEDGTGAVPGGVGGGYEFGVDPNEDPELALALRVSMEEQRARQEDEAKKAAAESARDTPATIPEDTNEEALLQQAIAMSQDPTDEGEEKPAAAAAVASPDFGNMTEEQQIAYALQMSMQSGGDEETAMETDQAEAKATGAEKEDEDYSEVIRDPAFLQSVLETLPGVDPQNEVIQRAMGSLRQDDKPDKDKKDKDPKDSK